jgi:cytochrome c oxidase cbb3-type subunit 3
VSKEELACCTYQSYKMARGLKKLMQQLTKTEPIENEMDILLDHDYDRLKSLIIIYRHGGCIFLRKYCFRAVYLVRFEIMEVIIRKWSYKLSSS